MATSGKINLPGEFDISPETNMRGENPPVPVSPKMEEPTYRMFDGGSAGDSHAGQNAPRNTRPAWTALQGELESARSNSGNSRTQGAGSRPDAFFAPLSGSAKGIGSSSPAAPSTGQAPGTPSRDFIFQVSERIQYQIREGKGELRIQLKPANLGRMEIMAETATNGVIARITTESNSVKSYLENNLHVLQQTLQDQGLKVERIYIVVHDGLDSSLPSGYGAQFGNTGSRFSGEDYRGSSGSPGIAAADPPEEISVDLSSWMALNPSVRFYTIA